MFVLRKMTRERHFHSVSFVDLHFRFSSCLTVEVHGFAVSLDNP